MFSISSCNLKSHCAKYKALEVPVGSNVPALTHGTQGVWCGFWSHPHTYSSPAHPEPGTFLVLLPGTNCSYFYPLVTPLFSSHNLLFSTLLLYWSNSHWEPQRKELLHVPGTQLTRSVEGNCGSARDGERIWSFTQQLPPPRKRVIFHHTLYTGKQATLLPKLPNCSSSNLQVLL